MDILMIAQYFGNIEQLEKGNNRFVYLASLLAQYHKVEVLTTSFVHTTKKYGRFIPTSFNGFKITALSEPGYKKNVCLRRFYSHKKLADKMSEYLKKRVTPDVIYCAVPSLDCAYMAMHYAKANKIPFIIDIQDLWPEAFKMVINVPIVNEVVFLPMSIKANKIYSNADYIIGVSQTYCDRAVKVNSKARTLPIFIGTDLKMFDNNVKNNKILRNDEKIVIGYCGTLGYSYDLICVFDALQILHDRGYKNIELWIMGTGPLYDTFFKYVVNKEIDVKFLGLLSYEKMCGVLSSCDMCINPISKGSAASIINKHADYASAGIPVINTQESKEYRNLIDEYQCGINCICNDAQSVAQAIQYLIDRPIERVHMGSNARKMSEERFDRHNTYLKVLNILDELTCIKDLI